MLGLRSAYNGVFSTISKNFPNSKTTSAPENDLEQQQQQQVESNVDDHVVTMPSIDQIESSTTTTTTPTFMDLSPTDRLQRQLARSFNNVKETCASPVPLKLDGQIPEWLIGSFYFMAPSTHTIPIRQSNDPESASMELKLSNWLDGFTMLHSFEFLPGGLNALYTQRKLSSQLESTIMSGKNAWSQAITFGTKKNDGAVENTWTKVASFLYPQQSSDQQHEQADKNSLDSSHAASNLPTNSGAFTTLLPFSKQQENNDIATPPFLLAFSPSTHLSLIDPVTLESNTIPIPEIATLFGSTTVFGSPQPVLDETTGTIYMPVLTLSHTGVTCTIMTSSVATFPNFTPFTTLPAHVGARACYPLQVAVTKTSILLVFPNYYIPSLSGSMWLKMYRNIYESAVYKPEEPMLFVRLDKATGRVLKTYSGAGGVIPPGGFVGAWEETDGSMHVDMVVHEDTKLYERLFLDSLRTKGLQGGAEENGLAKGSLRRYYLAPVGHTVAEVSVDTTNTSATAASSSTSTSATPYYGKDFDSGFIEQNFSGTEIHGYNIDAHYVYLSKEPVEFPIAVSTDSTKKPNVIVGLSQAHSGPASPVWFNRVVKLDIPTMEFKEWGLETDETIGSVQYIAPPKNVVAKSMIEQDLSDSNSNNNNNNEQHGVLLVTTHGANNSSGLVILSAKDLSELGRIMIPMEIVSGAHTLPVAVGGMGNALWTWGEVMEDLVVREEVKEEEVVVEETVQEEAKEVIETAEEEEIVNDVEEEERNQEEQDQHADPGTEVEVEVEVIEEVEIAPTTEVVVDGFESAAETLEIEEEEKPKKKRGAGGNRKSKRKSKN